MTLNELVSLFQQLASDHALLNSSAFGANSDIDIDNILYPQMYIEIEPMNLRGKDLLIPFSFTFSDRVAKDLRNEQSIISDMISVALDFRAMLNNPIYFDSFSATGDGAITAFRDSSTDETAGVILDLEIKLTDLKDRCQVPL